MTFTRVDRTAQIQGWMDSFKEIHPEAVFFNALNEVDTKAYIDDIYWSKMIGSIKPRMETGIDGYTDRHKVASLYEATISFLKPIVPENGDEDGPTNPLNYVFAYFVATVVMDTFNRKKGIALDYDIGEDFDREHKALLSICEVNDSFIFSNSACWYLIEKIAMDKG